MKKTIFLLFLCLFATAFLVACGGGSGDSDISLTGESGIQQPRTISIASVSSIKTNEKKHIGNDSVATLDLPANSVPDCSSYDVKMTKTELQGLDSNSLDYFKKKNKFDSSAEFLSPIIGIDIEKSSRTNFRGSVTVNDDNGFQLLEVSVVTVSLNSYAFDWNNYFYYLASKSNEKSGWSFTPLKEENFSGKSKKLEINTTSVSKQYVVLRMPQSIHNTDTQTETQTQTQTQTETQTQTQTQTQTETDVDTSLITEISVMAKPEVLIASSDTKRFEENMLLTVCVKYEGENPFAYSTPTVDFMAFSPFELGNSIKSNSNNNIYKYTYKGLVSPTSDIGGKATFEIIIPTKGMVFDPDKYPSNIFLTANFRSKTNKEYKSMETGIGFVYNAPTPVILTKTIDVTKLDPTETMDVATNTSVILKFSDDIIWTSSARQYVTISSDTEVLDCDYIYNSSAKYLVITPKKSLAYSHYYVVEVNDGLSYDENTKFTGDTRFAFTTADKPVDPVGPTDPTKITVAMTTPKADNPRIATNTVIVLTFSEPITWKEGESSSLINILDEASVKVNCIYTYNSSNNQLIMIPENPLNYSTTYTVAVGEGLKNEETNLMVVSNSFQFTTVAKTQVKAAISAVASSVVNGRIVLNPAFTVSFVNAVNSVTEAEAGVKVKLNEIEIAKICSWNPAKDKMTITFNSALNVSSTYKITMADNIMDVEGTAILPFNDYTFMTLATAESGDGSADNPFLIYTPEQLDSVRNNTSAHYKVMCDIDMTGYLSPTCTEEEGWLPIPGLSGTFDGNGKTIHGFKIYRYLTNQVGLFSQVTGSVKNLIIGDDVKIVGLNNVGGITGLLFGNTVISNCENNASVFAMQARAGGIAGLVDDTYSSSIAGNITNCRNNGEVYSLTGFASGICNSDGDLRCSYKHCCNYGYIHCDAGYCFGIAYNAYSITCCYNAGVVGSEENKSGTGVGIASVFMSSYNTGKVYGTGVTSSAAHSCYDVGDSSAPINNTDNKYNCFVTSTTRRNGNPVTSISYRDCSYVLENGYKAEIESKEWTGVSTWNDTSIWELHDDALPTLVNCGYHPLE